MRKNSMMAVAALLSLGALAFEKHMIRVPDELHPKEGIKGVTTYFFAPAAVSIPLKDGNWIYIVNETPKQEDEGGPAQIGVPKKIVELDVVSRYLGAMKRFPSITVQIGESTFFAYRCRDMFPAQDGLFLNNCYQGVVASMGSEYSISLFLPDGRGFDDEVRGILKRVTFVPCPGTAVESALKLYGPKSLLPAASRLPVVKKMVERRGECCELIELLSTLTDDATTKAWCAERLKKLNPGKYAADTRASIPYYDYNDKEQQKAVMEMLGASKGAEKAVVSVPVAALATGKTDATPAKPAPQPVEVAPKPAEVASKKPVETAPQPVEVAPKPAEVASKKPVETAPQPKVAVGPGPGEMTYKDRKWRYEINRDCTKVWLRKNPLDDYSGVVEFPAKLGGLPLKTIDRELFMDRKEMKGVVLPEGLETIEEKAFKDCTGIESLVLPASLKTIGEYAFYGCEAIRRVELPKGLKTLGGSAFEGCRNLEGDFDLRSLESLGRDVFEGCAKLHSVLLPDTLGEIGIDTFNSCSNLVNVAIPKSVGRIDSSAFRNCVSFKGVQDIPVGVTNIDWYAFASCTGLTGVNLPSGLVKLGDSVFMDCTALESLALPEGLKYAGEQLVKRCTALKEVSIPSSVKRVGASAFNGCTALKGVTLPQGLEKLENWAFKESGIESIDIPGGVKQIDPYAFASCASLKSVALHEGLKTIRKGAFKGCMALEEITIPASVETIEVEAFEGCTKLKKVVFLGKKPRIAMGTFKGCTSDVEKLEPHPPQLPNGYGSVKMKTRTVTLPGGAAMEMIYCPPGTYMMGTPEGMKKASSDDTKHPIKVTLTKGFWLGKYEVTQKQWQSVMGELSENTVVKGDDFPVHGISWVKADEFCKKVGGKARLPTEGEWEYACRAGAPTAFPWGNTANGTQLACDGTRPFSYEEDEDKIEKGAKHDKPVKVGSYRPNAWGFHDMNGNVFEWCSDWHMMYWEKTTELTDPRGEDEKRESRHKVMRGGAWDLGAWACTNSSRFDEDKDNRVCTRGFRMAMDE